MPEASSTTLLLNDIVLLRQKAISHLEMLSSDSFEGRKVGSKGGEKAQNYIINTLTDLQISPLNNQFKQTFILKNFYSEKYGNNIVGLIRGVVHPDKYIVLSAHFDHLGKNSRSIFNGADDNASGTAAILGIAELLNRKPPHYSIILLFTDGEESNLSGARAFVNENKPLLAHVKLNLNLDMLAGSKLTKRLNYISRGLEQLINEQQLIQLKDIQNNASIKIHKGFKSVMSVGSLKGSRQWLQASDHAVFYAAKIPFVYFGVGTHENYHKSSDDFKHVNKPLFLGATESIYQQLIFLDKNI